MMLTPVLEGWFSALLWFTSTLLPLGTGWLLVSHRWPIFNPEAFIEQRGLPLGLILTAGLISRRFAPSELTTAIAFTTLFMILADIAIQRWLAPYYSASRLIVLAIGGGGLGGLVWSGCYVQPFLLTGYSWGLWFVSYL